MKKEMPGGVVVTENKKRKLAYTKEFRLSLFLKSGVLRKFLDWNKKISDADKEKQFEDGEFKITPLFKPNNVGRYFKLTFGTESYFVKESTKHHGGGADEILDSNNLIGILKKERIDYAEVVKFKAGYQDSDRVYYVAAWDERLTKTAAELESDGRLNERERKEIREKCYKLSDLLRNKYGYWDITFRNMSYDPQTKNIIIFDPQRHKRYL